MPISGGPVTGQSGLDFEKLLAAICEGRIGAVVSLGRRASRGMAVIGHTLLEFCNLVGTLIVDEEAIYDPRSPNDRLLLGMKLFDEKVGGRAIDTFGIASPRYGGTRIV